MRALRLHRVEAAPSIDSVELPTASDGQVLVRVRAAGICGSDRHIVAGHNPLPEYPRTLGHEVAGDVAAVGAGVASIGVGQRVAVNFLVSCRSCEYCSEGRASLCTNRVGIGVARDGGLAEYVLVPENNAIPIPDNVPYDHAAIATDAFASPLHAIRRSGVRAGDACLVVGAGGLGLSAVQLLVALGAGSVTVVDTEPLALEAALRAGATTATTAEELKARGTRDRLEDRVRHSFDFVGSPETVLLALDATGRGGRVNVVGLSDRTLQLVRGEVLVREEKTIAGSYSFDAAEIREALDLMARGLVQPELVIGGRIDLDQAVDALHPDGRHDRSTGRTVVRLDPAPLEKETVPA
ncbi:Zn-dependent oxidoreductase [Sinomonas notoginsengisoli]|uniref:alcohol dehydrogenase catalytic domain-containing protein n=1 Tax=Sinomonas notoginsengisoli TaxID=1457311 RepID=UPI001F296ED9|nr:zinc-binding dehydrogenase [Sinomonas notoginsengisoli]